MSKNKVSADSVSLETSPCLAESHLLTMAPHSFYSVPMCTWSLFPGSSVHGFLQARKLEWVDIPFSRGSPQPRDQTWVSCFGSKLFTIWATTESSHIELGLHYFDLYYLFKGSISKDSHIWDSKCRDTIQSMHVCMNAKLFQLCTILRPCGL